MDHLNQDVESQQSGFFGRLSGASSSRRRSLSVQHSLSQKFDDAGKSESGSEAGDIGERAFHHSKRTSGSGRSHFSLDVTENGIVVPIQDDNLSQPSANAGISGEKKIDEEEVPWVLVYITCLVCLADFGILGVLARYGLEKLFGPDIIGATSDHSYMYPDLPANMAGSFLMGWLGVVFKPDIMEVSDQLGIGLTTGFLGSLTTFSGWNQKMLDLSVEGKWVFAVLGYLLGMFLAAYSIIFGIQTAKGFKWLLHRRSTTMRSVSGITTRHHSCISNKSQCMLTFMAMLLLLLGLLWGVFGFLEKIEFRNGGSEAELFLACMVGPFGVWIRFFLARFNGRGLGKNGAAKWIPFGTLAANVLAACVMAALATLKKAVNTKNCETVASGIQLGLLGCLSTVSTFIAEFHAMTESNHPWRAFGYAALTIIPSFVLGTLIYSVPVWTRGYN